MTSCRQGFEDFSDHLLDEMIVEQQLAWLGVGKQQITLCYAEELPLHRREASAAWETELTSLFLDRQARYGYHQLSDRGRRGLGAVQRALVAGSVGRLPLPQTAWRLCGWALCGTIGLAKPRPPAAVAPAPRPKGGRAIGAWWICLPVRKTPWNGWRTLRSVFGRCSTATASSAGKSSIGKRRRTARRTRGSAGRICSRRCG